MLNLYLITPRRPTNTGEVGRNLPSNENPVPSRGLVKRVRQTIYPISVEGGTRRIHYHHRSRSLGQFPGRVEHRCPLLPETKLKQDWSLITNRKITSRKTNKQRSRLVPPSIFCTT